MAHLFFGNNHTVSMGAHDLKFSPKRDFHAMPNLLAAVAPNKTFNNPNFVNNLTKYQQIRTDSQRMTKNYKNSSLINTIKEHCPEMIENPNFCMVDKDSDNNNLEKTKLKNTDIVNRERSHQKKQPRKNSKHNENRQLLKEIMDINNIESPQDSFELLNTPPTTYKFDLSKILIDKPLRKMVSTIPIPVAGNKDMVVTIIAHSPPTRPTQMSKSKSLEKIDRNMSVNEVSPKNNYKTCSLDTENQFNKTDRLSNIDSLDHEKNDISEINATPKNGHKLYLYDKHGKPTDSLKPINGLKKIYRFQNKGADMDSLSNRLIYPSICDSQDSLIAFEDDVCQNLNQNNKPSSKLSFRNRIPSICESEDSFIIFDDDNDTDESDLTNSDGDMTDFEEECEIECDDDGEHTQSEEESSFDLVDGPKKVRFATTEKLCKVYPMVKWSYAYQAARKGPWEEIARDRTRFKDRIRNTEEKIKNIFGKEHRDNVFKTRFQNEECKKQMGG